MRRRGRNPRAKIGRPVYGRMRFSEARIRELPPQGSPAEMATVLGVSTKTVRGWIVLHGAPADVPRDWPFPSKPYRKYVIKKETFVRWLEKTERFKPRKEY